MNMLNSIIFEGNIVKSKGLEYVFPEVPQMEVTICVERTYKNRNNDTVTEKSEFDIVAYGPMAEHLSEHSAEGQGIRVVGRLKQVHWKSGDEEYSRVFIVAEHIEYRPSKKKETKDEE